jgi:HSP20 family protein
MKARHSKPEGGSRWGHLGELPGLTAIIELSRDDWEPPVDVRETDEGLIVCMELAGLHRQDVSVRVEGRELIVAGERKLEEDTKDHFPSELPTGPFERRVTLPDDVIATAEKVDFEEGILSVTFHKDAR